MDILTFNLHSEAKFRDREWAPFLDIWHDWFGQRCRGEGVVYCLYPSDIDECLKLFRIDSDFCAAEREFAELCDRHNAIGVSRRRFIDFPLLRPLLPMPEKRELSPFLELGWTESDVASFVNLQNPTAKINRRLRAAAGRLICSPMFLSAIATIRERWDRLPVEIRPMIPIARSTKVPTANAALGLEPEPALLSEFMTEFDRFCDEWHLLGMAT